VSADLEVQPKVRLKNLRNRFLTLSQTFWECPFAALMHASGGGCAHTSLMMGVTRSSLLSHLIFNRPITCFVTASGSCEAV
jgi:hypothetical protein